MSKEISRVRVSFGDVVIPADFNSRKTFLRIDELAESIDEAGLLSPLVVREGGSDKEGKRKYFLVAGARRYRAIEKLRDPAWVPPGKDKERNTTPASWAMVEVKCVKGSTQELAALHFIENIQREDVDPVEEAAAMKEYIDQYEITQAVLAAKLGKSEPYVSQRLSLLKNTADEVKDALAAGEISPTQVREIVTLPKTEQKEVLAEIQAHQKKDGKGKGKKMPVEEVKAVADKVKDRLGIKKDKPRKKAAEPEYDSEKVAIAKEIYAEKEINCRPKTAILEQVGALSERMKRANLAEDSRVKAKNYIAALEFALGLRETL